MRYLIGKDLVQASVNCDSSLVTPNVGKSFVPDMTGATREMIKIACGNQPSPNPTPVMQIVSDLCLNAMLRRDEAFSRYMATPLDLPFLFSTRRQTFLITQMLVEQSCD
ncbi:hypothetical protein H6F51_14365 [Cyanobacteria bacterium FACHB-DQ100]|nr:hypothetical protein [Cyanobacteria bacterium FACHB-DQ100]